MKNWLLATVVDQLDAVPLNATTLLEDSKSPSNANTPTSGNNFPYSTDESVTPPGPEPEYIEYTLPESTNVSVDDVKLLSTKCKGLPVDPVRVRYKEPGNIFPYKVKWLV